MSCHVSGENLAISKYCVVMREGQGLALGNIIYQVQKAKFHGTITITVLEITMLMFKNTRFKEGKELFMSNYGNDLFRVSPIANTVKHIRSFISHL